MPISQKRFQRVNIEISNICNLKCSFCPEVVRSHKLMEVDLFTRIIREVAPLTECVCFHLMGDPLVHPQLAQLVSICEREKVKIFFVTNGVLLRDAQVDTLLSPAFYQVNFSLHSFFDNYPDRDPEPYLNRIFAFTRKAFEFRPELYINYRLWNLQDPLAGGGQNAQMLHRIQKEFSWEFKPQDVRRRKSYPILNRLYLHLDTQFVWPALDLPFLGDRGTCKGLSDHFGILVDGTVVPCCLDKEGSIPLGQVGEQAITEILSAPRAKNILEGFRNRQLKEDLCQRCNYIQRFN